MNKLLKFQIIVFEYFILSRGGGTIDIELPIDRINKSLDLKNFPSLMSELYLSLICAETYNDTAHSLTNVIGGFRYFNKKLVLDIYHLSAKELNRYFKYIEYNGYFFSIKSDIKNSKIIINELEDTLLKYIKVITGKDNIKVFDAIKVGLSIFYSGAFSDSENINNDSTNNYNCKNYKINPQLLEQLNIESPLIHELEKRNMNYSINILFNIYDIKINAEWLWKYRNDSFNIHDLESKLKLKRVYEE